MSITINLNNPDSFDIKSTKLYRSEIIPDPLNPTGLITTLGEGVTSYVDDTIPLQSSRYYLPVIEDSTGAEMYMSVSNHGNFPTTGPGRTRPIRGDWKLGYMGTLVGDGIEFMNAQQLWDACGLTDNDITPVTTDLLWHKLCYNDRIIFWPQTSVIVATVSIPMAPLDKLTSPMNILYNGLNYNVTVPRMDTTANFISNLTSPDPDSDFMKLLMMLHNTQTISTSSPELVDTPAKLAGFTLNELFGNGSSARFLMREKNLAGNRVRFPANNNVSIVAYPSGQFQWSWQPYVELIST